MDRVGTAASATHGVGERVGRWWRVVGQWIPTGEVEWAQKQKQNEKQKKNPGTPKGKLCLLHSVTEA